MMSKYTPGPWEVKFNEWKNTIICKEDNCIAEVSLYGQLPTTEVVGL